MSSLLGPVEIRELAARVGLDPRKSLGQNFVIDQNTITRIVRLAQLAPDDVVLEVGPGLGSLTLGLLPVAAAVVAVEIDGALAAELPHTVRAHAPALADRLTVLHADALQLSGPASLVAPAGHRELSEPGPEPSGARPGPLPTALVANLPYNVAVPVLLQCLARFPSVTTALVLVQSEVADRLAAGPGSRTYGIPSVKAAWFGETRRVGSVGPNVFWPVPHVESGLVRLVRRPRPLGTGVEGAAADPPREQVFALVDAAFAHRRKTLRAGLASWFGSPVVAEEHLRAAGLDPGARAEQLGVEAFVALARTALATTALAKTVSAPTGPADGQPTTPGPPSAAAASARP